MLNLKDLPYPTNIAVQLLMFATWDARAKTYNKNISDIKNGMAIFFSDEEIEKAVNILSASEA